MGLERVPTLNGPIDFCGCILSQRSKVPLFSLEAINQELSEISLAVLVKLLNCPKSPCSSSKPPGRLWPLLQQKLQDRCFRWYLTKFLTCDWGDKCNFSLCFCRAPRPEIVGYHKPENLPPTESSFLYWQPGLQHGPF